MQDRELLQKALQNKNMMVLYRDDLMAPETGRPILRWTVTPPCAPETSPRQSRWTTCRF